MKQELVEALDEIAGAFGRILTDPAFLWDKPPLTTDLAGLTRMVRSGFSNHTDLEILDALRVVHRAAPSNFTSLFEGYQKLRAIRDFRDVRDKSMAYRVAVAPTFLPKVLGVLGLLKFSSRDVQWFLYYLLLGLEAVSVSWVLSWFNPDLVPGVVSWCLLSEFVERDLEIEEALSSNCLFALLVMSGNVESLLEVCRERGIEVGKLFQAGDQLTMEVSWESMQEEVREPEPADFSAAEVSRGVSGIRISDILDEMDNGVFPNAGTGAPEPDPPEILVLPEHDDASALSHLATLIRTTAAAGTHRLTLRGDGTVTMDVASDRRPRPCAQADTARMREGFPVLVDMIGFDREDPGERVLRMDIEGEIFHVVAHWIREEPGTLVLKLRNGSQPPIPYTRLGLSTLPRARLWSEVCAKEGLVLLVGRPGAGLSTSLASMAVALHASELMPVMVQHRIEFPVEGVSQLSCQRGAEDSFLEALETALELGPDVILIDDADPTEVAAALEVLPPRGLTLVVAQADLDPARALDRIQSHESTPGILGERLRLVVHQELVQRLPDSGGEAWSPDPDELAGAGYAPDLVTGFEERFAAGQERVLWRDPPDEGGSPRPTGLFQVLDGQDPGIQDEGGWFSQSRSPLPGPLCSFETDVLDAVFEGRVSVGALDRLHRELRGDTVRTEEPDPTPDA